MRCTAIGLSAVLLMGSLLFAGHGRPSEVAQTAVAQPSAPTEAVRGKGDPESALARLKKISFGIVMYGGDYDDALPPSLAKLMEEKYAPGEAFVVDGSGTATPKTAAEVAAGKCDFLYFGAGRAADGLTDDDPLACTKPGLLAGGVIAVLYADNHVEVHDQIPAKVKKAIIALGKRH